MSFAGSVEDEESEEGQVGFLVPLKSMDGVAN